LERILFVKVALQQKKTDKLLKDKEITF
jgi:hypothetical protein